MITDDFKTRMRQGNKPKTLRVSVPSEPAVVNEMSAADLDLLLSRSCTAVQRPMTEEERQAVSQGKSPMVSYSSAEKRELLKCGWKEGDPVPPNIAAILAEIVQEYQAKGSENRSVPQGKMIVTEIDDLPPQEQARMRAAVQDAIAQMKANQEGSVSFSAYSPDIADSVKDYFSEKEVVIPDWQGNTTVAVEPSTDDFKDRMQKSSSPKRESTVDSSTPPAPAHAEKVGEQRSKEIVTGQRCVHCGGDPFEDITQTDISREDKRNYLLAIGTGKSFEKEYTVFHDTITVRFRALRPGERDLIQAWASEKANEATKKRAVDFKTFIEIANYHERIGLSVIQTTYLRGNLEQSSLLWRAPEGNRPWLKDWTEEYGIQTLDDLIEKFQESVGSEAVMLAIQERLSYFSILAYRLTNSAADTENFWKGT